MIDLKKRLSTISSREDGEFRVPYYRRLSVRIFGKYVSRYFKTEKIERDLRRAKLGMSGVEFYSQSMFSAIILAAAIAAILLVIVRIVPGLALLAGALGFLAIVAFIAITLEMPSNIVRARKRRIDSIITTAIGYFATMASADIPVDIIFRDLGGSRQYGEISREARSIWLRSSVFGQDIISSIREAARYSPSQNFADFLQGIITSVNSGGDLKSYFTSKADQFQEETRSRIRQNSESLGILSEAFVTVGVAFPLIFLIIVGVVAFLSPVPPAGYITVLIFTVTVMIPAILGVFAYFFSTTVGEIEI